MNSEELEQSLRSEFETYLNTVVADLRQGSVEFQKKIQAEFDRHRAQFDEAFTALFARFDTTPELDEAFGSSVAEHLKLARDDGAKVAATAMVEAEKFDEAPATARYDSIRDAVNDISSKDSQSTILKTLVQHAGEFAPRGAFFIIKSGHFAGWKVFGTEEDLEHAIRGVHFPTSQDTILSKAINLLQPVESSSGGYSQNDSFTGPLSFGHPSRMMAFPLVARGRGVAVLYVDSGDGENDINREALETITRVAGLTVELLASTQTAAEENRTMAPADFENTRHDESIPSPRPYDESTFQVPVSEVLQRPQGTDFSFSDRTASDEHTFERPDDAMTDVPSYGQEANAPDTDFGSTIPNLGAERPNAFQPFDQGSASSEIGQSQSEGFKEAAPPSYDFSFETQSTAEHSDVSGTTFSQPENRFGQSEFGGQSTYQDSHTSTPQFGESSPQFGSPTTPNREAPPVFEQLQEEYRGATPEYQRAEEFQPQPTEFQSPVSEFQSQEGTRSSNPFDADPPSQNQSFDSSPFDTAVEQYRPANASSGTSYAPSAPEPIVPAPAVSAPQARLSDRPVDLPIEVPEEERRLHNDARRFARLLVSEIKLYNEKKVIEGKQSHDLYDRLREAIDRSREMYDKRVQPPVASKFDYFHYELLNSLAEGSIDRLGPDYPGAKV